MKICLDMDSVLADIIPVCCQIIEEQTGIKKGKLQLNWDFLNLPELKGKIDYDSLFRETWKRWYDIHPTEEYIGGKVGELMLLGTVDIVTSSNDHSVNGRKKWLSKYHVPYSKFMNIGHGVDKMSLDYDVWIDDAPYQAEAAFKKDKRLLLYTQPFNLYIPEEGKVKRIFSLSDARRLLMENKT